MTDDQHRVQVERVRQSELRADSSAERHGIYPRREPMRAGVKVRRLDLKRAPRPKS